MKNKKQNKKIIFVALSLALVMIASVFIVNADENNGNNTNNRNDNHRNNINNRSDDNRNDNNRNNTNSEKKEARATELEARYVQLQCKVEVIKAQAKNVGKYMSISGLDESIAKLDSDMTTLKAYADSQDAKGFTNFVQSTIPNDAKAVQDTVKNAKKDVKNLGAEQKKGIKDDWQQSLTSYGQCNSDSRRKVVEARGNVLTAQKSQWQNAVDDMKSKGLDASGMEAVISDLGQLTTALNDATNAQSDADFKAKIADANDLNLHLWARFNIARVNAYLAKVEPVANSAGLGAKVAEIKGLLSDASALAAPGRKYAAGEFQKAWNDIKSASEKLSDLTKSLKQNKQNKKAKPTSVSTSTTVAGGAQ